MKLTGMYNGEPIELELTEEQMETLGLKRKKTGWERAEEGESYWIYDALDKILEFHEVSDCQDDRQFSHANYFSDKALVENIIRAQTLQRKLWRRSAELCEKANWNDSTSKFGIYYDYYRQSLFTRAIYILNNFGQVYFDTKEHAEQVMDEFHDELIWYFTKFKSRMD